MVLHNKLNLAADKVNYGSLAYLSIEEAEYRCHQQSLKKQNK